MRFLILSVTLFLRRSGPSGKKNTLCPNTFPLDVISMMQMVDTLHSGFGDTSVTCPIFREHFQAAPLAFWKDQTSPPGTRDPIVSTFRYEQIVPLPSLLPAAMGLTRQVIQEKTRHRFSMKSGKFLSQFNLQVHQQASTFLPAMQFF